MYESSTKNNPCATTSKSATFKEYTSPSRIFKRVKSYYDQLNEERFFTKFMAAKGGLTTLVTGILIIPVIAVSGLTMTAVALGVSAIGLITFGTAVSIIYGGKWLKSLQDQIWRYVFKKPPKPPKPINYGPQMSLGHKITRIELIKNLRKTAIMQRIESAPLIRQASNSPLWRHLNKIGRDQEILLRAVTTSGSLATIVIAVGIVATQAVALPAVTVSLAAVFAVYAVASVLSAGVSIFKDGIKLVKSTHDLLKKQKSDKKTEIPTPESIPTFKSALKKPHRRLPLYNAKKDFKNVISKNRPTHRLKAAVYRKKISNN